MHHDIPEGYYSILEVFDFLGADTFRFSWTGKEVKIGKDDLLSKKLSYTAQWIRRELEAFSLGLYAHSKYGQYIEVGSHRQDLWCKLTKNFSQKIVNHISYLASEEKKFGLEYFLAPNSTALTLDSFVQHTMRYLATRRRLLLMLDGAPIKGYIQNAKTGEIHSIEYWCWLKSEEPFSPNFELNFFEGTGVYKFHNSTKFEIFRGPLLLSEKSFDAFREGERPEWEPDWPLRFKQELKKEGRKKEQTAAADLRNVNEGRESVTLETPIEPTLTPKGSTHMIILYKCFEELKISNNNQPSLDEVREWLKQNAPFIHSEREIRRFFTILREPEMKKGGAWTKEEAAIRIAQLKALEGLNKEGAK